MAAHADTSIWLASAWRQGALVRASLLLHGACIGVLVFDPAAWPWALATLAGNHAVLTLAVFFPRAQWLGPNVTRLPASAQARGEVCLTFDDGPDPERTPQVLDLLERHGARATFFCIGEKAAAHPAVVRDIVRRGHSVENHTYRHSVVFACLGIGGLGREVDRAQEVLARLSGRAPAFFRAPAGFRSPLLHVVLAKRGLRYVSWTRRGLDGRPVDPKRVSARLSRGLVAGDVLLLHDTGPLVVPVLTELLAELSRRGLRSVSLPSAL